MVSGNAWDRGQIVGSSPSSNCSELNIRNNNIHVTCADNENVRSSLFKLKLN